MAGNNGTSLQKYEADSGEIHAIRLKDTTLTLDLGTGPQVSTAAAPTSEFWAQASRGATEYGLRPRAVGVCFTGTPPADLEAGPTYEVVVIDKALFDAVTLTAAVTYQGAAAQVVSKRSENIYPGI